MNVVFTFGVLVNVKILNVFLHVLLSAIGNAYAVLSNTEKRRQYDQYGEERSHPSRHRRDFEADISPEDLFNMFFGGGFPSSKHRKVLLRFCCVKVVSSSVYLEQHYEHHPIIGWS